MLMVAGQRTEPSPSTDQHLLSVFSDFERHRPWFCSCKTTNQNKEKTKHTALHVLSEKNPREKVFFFHLFFFFFGKAVITLTLVMTQRDELAPAQK